MKFSILFSFWIGLLFCAACFAADDANLGERQPWTTSRIHGSPEPPKPYTVEQVFPEIKFNNPVDFGLEPGTGRWWVLQLDGKLFVFDPDAPQAPLLIHDAKATHEGHNHSYGLEFHPDYLKNRQIFLSYTQPNTDPDGTHISRFAVKQGKIPEVDPESEGLILTWPSGGHNGAAMKFGPDGMLYITSGDGTGPFPPDSADVGQNIADLRSTIMRIDVDHPTQDHPYSVPIDNPFIDIAGARPEVWAFGFRNPWKISFDAKTGELWCGDVGWELWELVYNVTRGGNYGWSVREGSQPVRNDLPQGPGEIIPPVTQHHHTEAASVTGGYVYYGEKYPELVGKYIYGDYVSGKIWAIENAGNQLTSIEEIADTSLAIITFGVDAAGELIVVDYAGGLYRIVPNPVPDTSKDFPIRLSETGLYKISGDSSINQPGVYSYYTNAKMWQDGANATYEIAIPGNNSIVWSNNHERWQYPDDTVFAKTLSMWTIADNTLKNRKIETQILHFDGKQWNPYSYLWDDDESDARLVDASGISKTLTVPARFPDVEDGKAELKQDELLEYEWSVASRAECSACHVPRAGHVIGFDLPNLNRQAWNLQDQIKELSRLRIFDKEIPEKRVPDRMYNSWETGGDLENRARSYLAMNCAHCHRRGGGGTAHIEFPFEHSLEQTRAVDALPTQGTFDIKDAKIIAPGDPHRSVLYYRMATIGRGHMPHLGAQQVDQAGLDLIAEWIRSLDSDHQPNAESVVPLLQNEFSESSDAVRQVLSSTESSLAATEQLGQLDEDVRVKWSRVLASAAPIHLRGLFERYLPESERQKTLGTAVDAAEILRLKGSAQKGKDLFHTSAGLNCRNCHQIGETGKAVGPNLSKIGGQRSRSEILESILYPSRKIDQKFAMRTIATDDGLVISGIVVKETDETITLKDSADKNHVISRSEIDEMVTQPRSLMPDLLVKEMTAQELVDLLDYLAILK